MSTGLKLKCSSLLNTGDKTSFALRKSCYLTHYFCLHTLVKLLSLNCLRYHCAATGLESTTT